MIAPSRLTRWLILGAIGGLFLVPLLSMIEFTTRAGLEGGYSADRWLGLLTGDLGTNQRVVVTGLQNSLVLAALSVSLTLLILVPTMLLVHLKIPALRRVLEFVCLIPITVPAIVLVVGLAPVYARVAQVFGSSVWTLCFVYGILTLPFAYRAIQSSLSGMDAVTLSEAARSLGAGWPTVLWRVLLPNLRRGIMAAALIGVAVVMGEFTIASLLNRQNLQTGLVIASQTDPWVAVQLSLLALLLAFVLLLAMGRASARAERTFQ